VADEAGIGENGIEISDEGPVIRALARLGACSPGRALAAFTDPAVLAGWWGGVLTADLAPGGEYTVAFPAIPATLTGRVVGYVPASSLEFSWSWDGQRPDSAVAIRVNAGPGEQTTLVIEHGPHSDDADGRTAHAEHWAGWEFFLPKLRSLLAE